MAKSNKSSSKKASPLMGKGKVTPIQIAFIVERFLANNNYPNTLAAFRSEASDLFFKTKGKGVPKGLLGLEDILDEYISLKEQRVMVDQEKRRVEIAFQGLSDVMRAFNSPQSPTTHLQQNPNAGSPPQGHMIHGSFVNHAQLQQPMLPHKAEEMNKFSTPVPNCSSGRKRSGFSSAPKAPPPPKKFRAGSTKDSSIIEDVIPTGRVPQTNNTQVNIESTSTGKLASPSQITRSPAQGSSIAKRLFKNPPESQANSSSPKTPPIENSSPNAKGASNCAIISSQTIIISPLKRNGCYSVERSYNVSASSLKSSPETMNKRDHVKGRLDFDEPCAPQSSEEPVAIESSPSTTDGDAVANFDFDLPDFDFFDGEFTKLLCDINLDCEQVHSSQQTSAHSELLPCVEQNVNEGCLEINQALPNTGLSTVTETISQKDMNFQGRETMTTVRSITKRIMISTPSEVSSNFSLEQIDSPLKP